MIQLLFFLLCTQVCLLFLLLFKNPCWKLTTLALDHLNHGHGAVIAKTVAATLFVVLGSSVFSVAKIVSRSEEFGTLNPTDQVLMSRRLLESSLLGPQVLNNRTITISHTGNADFKSINEALNFAPRKASEYFKILIDVGVYAEYVIIPRDMPFLVFAGAGIDKTIIIGNHSVGGGSSTGHSATFAVEAANFVAYGITFQNTAGPEEHQAVALKVSEDHAAFYKCSIVGYQDTLYVKQGTQFYKECDIYGTVDFIFGDAAAIFQNCNIYTREPMAGQENTITAQGRSSLNKTTGFSFHNCAVKAAPDLNNTTKTFLGRPWKQFSTTVFMLSFIGELIDPAGWLAWNPSFNDTVYYGEYQNWGPGAINTQRVKWAGYHRMNQSEAKEFTVENFIGGQTWLPSAGVPYTPGL